MEDYTEKDVTGYLQSIGYEFNYNSQLRYSKSRAKNEVLLQELRKLQRTNYLLFIAIVDWFLGDRYPQDFRTQFNVYFLLIADLVVFQLEVESPPHPTRSIDLDEHYFWVIEATKRSPVFTFQKTREIKPRTKIQIQWGYEHEKSTDRLSYILKKTRIPSHGARVVTRIEERGRDLVRKIARWMQKDNYKLVLINPKTKTPVLMAACIACNGHADMVCGNCNVASYCGVSCQKTNWDAEHASVCSFNQ